MMSRWINIRSTVQFGRMLSTRPGHTRPLSKSEQAFRSAVQYASRSPLVLYAGFTVVGTALYVVYRDWVRYRRMMDRFSRGAILEPLCDNQHQVVFFARESDEQKLGDILKSEICSQYYFIFGEVGTGKTRLIVEVIRKKLRENGSQKEGAPVYVLASQGNSFPDSFAATVNYSFDEHISLKFLLDYIFRVGELPKRDEKTKLDRVLNAIEKAAYMYLEKYHKPAVIVIDGVNWITDSFPGALERIQEKAKLWADTNIAKIIFVSNDEKTEMILQGNHSAWARGALPLFIGDLAKMDARRFLLQKDVILEHARARHGSGREEAMSEEHIDKIYDLVGGRLQQLLWCKLEWVQSKPFEYTANHLKLKERTKFFEFAQTRSQRKVIDILYGTPGHELLLQELIDMTSREDVNKLALANIIKIERDDKAGLLVKFQSRLTEVVVEEMMAKRDARRGQVQ